MKEKKTFIEMIKTLGVKLFNGLKRYPVSIGMAAAASIVGVILIHSEDAPNDTVRLLLSIIMALVIGVLFSLIVKTVIENNSPTLKIQWFLWIVVGTFSLLYAIYLYNNLENMEMFETVRFAALVLAGFVLFMTAVFRKKTDYQEVYSTLSGWRLAITTIYTFIIWGGISLILFAIDELLGVNIKEEAYFDTIVLAAGFFAPVFFFGGVPKTEDELGPDRIYKFFKILVVYVIAPLLTAYTVVFYIYALRILFTWDWPNGVVGNMVLWYAIIGTVAMYFLRGMDGESKWAKIFGKWFPRIIILPIILLFISLVIRINAYGFTANRYFLGVTGAWALGCAVYMSIVNYKKRSTRVITVSLVLIALLSVIGPWNAINVGRISQTNRLEKLLVENDILVGGSIVKSSSVPEEAKGAISSKLEFLEDGYDFKGVDFLPEGFTTRDMKDVLGFEYLYYYEAGEPGMEKGDYMFINSDIVGAVVDVGGYDYIWDSDKWESEVEIDDEYLKLGFNRNENENIFWVEYNDSTIIEEDIRGYLDIIRDRWDSQNGQMTLDNMSFDISAPPVDIRLVFTDVELHDVDSRGFGVGWVRFYVLIRKK